MVRSGRGWPRPDTGARDGGARSSGGRWKDLFNVEFEVLLYDLTHTCFEANPPFDEADNRRLAHTRERRNDCVQAVIARVVTPEGLPLACEVLPGNTADNTMLRDFLTRIEIRYGKARRVRVLDRGIPTDAVLREIRHSDPPVHSRVGTPKGRLSRSESELRFEPSHEARPSVQVKLLAQDGEMYVSRCARSIISQGVVSMRTSGFTSPF